MYWADPFSAVTAAYAPSECESALVGISVAAALPISVQPVGNPNCAIGRYTNTLVASPTRARATIAPSFVAPIAAIEVISQRQRKIVEEFFGWGKTISTMRRSKHIERFKIRQQAQLTAATYNLVRMCRLLAA